MIADPTTAARLREKRVAREALQALADLTVQDMARRLGCSSATLYAARNPNSPNRLGPDRLRHLANLYRQEAARLARLADQLEDAAATTDPLG